MTEYIDRKVFIEDIKTEIINIHLDGLKGTPRPHDELYEFIDRIKEQPTADVAPVVHEVIEEGEEKVQPMTGTEFQEKAMRTAATSDSDKLLLNGVMGLNGESGECIDVLKKYLFQGHELDEEKLMDELSDVMWYAAITATGLGVTLDEVMEHNVEKLKNRYPDGFDKDRSIHREG